MTHLILRSTPERPVAERGLGEPPVSRRLTVGAGMPRVLVVARGGGGPSEGSSCQRPPWMTLMIAPFTERQVVVAGSSPRPRRSPDFPGLVWKVWAHDDAAHLAGERLPLR